MKKAKYIVKAHEVSCNGVMVDVEGFQGSKRDCKKEVKRLKNGCSINKKYTLFNIRVEKIPKNEI